MHVCTSCVCLQAAQANGNGCAWCEIWRGLAADPWKSSVQSLSDLQRSVCTATSVGLGATGWAAAVGLSSAGGGVVGGGVARSDRRLAAGGRAGVYMAAVEGLRSLASAQRGVRQGQSQSLG